VNDVGVALTGCLLGQALGDAIGFVVEAKPAREAREYVEEYLLAGRAGERSHPGFPFGQYSDDTQLARDLVLSFVEAGGWSAEGFGRRLAALFEAGGDVGAGPGTRAAALRLLAGAHWSGSGTPAPYAGNGSAMRAAPLGLLLAGDTRSMVEATIEQSLVTHRDPRCSAGALAVAGAARIAAEGGRIRHESFLDDLAELTSAADQSVTQAILDLRHWVHLPPEDAIRPLRAAGLDPADTGEWRGISASVTPSVLWSLYAFLRTPEDYWATVCTAVGAGGDTDTMAAIAGAISGARLGAGALPASLVERLQDRGRWRSAALTDLAHRAAQLVGC
jgi:ADP-ribosylglycohydrolase